MKRIWLIIILFLIIGSVLGLILSKKELLLNPLSDKKSEKNKENKLETFGFLPTWMVGKTRVYGEEVDNLIFLGIEVNKNGDLIWETQAKKINNETFLEQKKKIKESGGKNILGIKLFKDEDLNSLLENKTARENLVKQVKQLKIENNFDGVNIDFEYQGDPTAILNQNFLDFLDQLKLAGLQNISVDVFANTIIKGSAEEIGNLMGKIDNLIIMAYDFHRPGVDYAGAVAPIGSPVGERNITEIIGKILNANLDKNKIVMAYPLYGYEWKTYTEEFGSQIKRGWYQMASWNRTKELIKEKNLEVKWDEISMSPWISFKENGVIHQIYYENEKSLKAKLDLVKQNQLGGYGYWALGYEGEDKSVWY
jgi:spore germination protein YaaH